MTQYLGQGVPPSALLQWALYLGWGHPNAQFDKQHPKISLSDMPNLFMQGGLRASNCNMNIQKLDDLVKKWTN